MIRRLLITILLQFSLTLFPANAQFSNNIWMWGTWPNDTTWQYRGITKITFDADTLHFIEDQNNKINIHGVFSGLETPDQQYFIYTNGYTIANKFHDTIANGSGLSPGGTYNNYVTLGHPLPTAAVLLPFPGSDRLIAMIHLDNYPPIGSNYHAKNIFYSLIDPSGNNGQGLVMIKNQIIISDTISSTGLNVVRHANGRDWWIVIKRLIPNEFITILLSPAGPEVKFIQDLGGPDGSLGGQASFSPDGTKFAGFSNQAYQLRIYDFDRCSGLLSNMLYKYITPETAGSVSFSPDNRFLYVSNWQYLWQFDMQANDILNSQVLIDELDTSLHDPATGWVSGWAWHYMAQDGKIYLQNFSGVMLNVINKPNEPGIACHFVQNQIQFPTYYYATVPTYVNLDLLQIPGSACDTLGVGIKEETVNGLKLKINPNPNKGNFYIEYKAHAQSGLLYLYDINGKEILKENISAYTTIHEVDLSNKIAPGIYALALMFGEKREMIKLAVE